MKLLLLDMSFLAYRAFHTTGKLEWEGSATGTIYGILKEVLSLLKKHEPSRAAFCFDSKHSLRKRAYPEYKGDRKKSEESQERKDFISQLVLLRRYYLKKIGFNNIFIQKGYEADDIIAQLVKDWMGHSCIIVSADHDLLQLVGGPVRLWDPIRKEFKTMGTVIKEHRIHPFMWPKVKAIAGGKDNIKGVQGVGKKTAIKFLLGELNPESATYKRILASKEQIELNLGLSLLPYPGTESREIEKDVLSKDGWNEVISELGFESLKKNPFAGVNYGN